MFSLEQSRLWCKICDLLKRVTALEDNPPTVNTKETDLIVVFASGRSNGIQRNCTITTTATGRHQVRFDTNHPDARYEIVLGQDESGALRDVPKVSVVEGTQNAAGFDIQVTVDDNGGAADSYSNDAFSFATFHQITIVEVDNA